MTESSHLDTPGAGPSVRELQELARQAARPRRRSKPGISRAARLHLIDILSRWGGSGVALVAGVAIFVAISSGRAYPFRAAIWGLMVLVALYVCEKLRKQFRAGESLTARPFRWRANYTSSLSVLSAVFGAGALLILPSGAPTELCFQNLSLLLAASLSLGLAHSAHGRSTAASALPAAVFIFFGAWRAAGMAAAVAGVGGAILTGGASLYLFNRYLKQRAAARFPRTGFIRRENERLDRSAERKIPSTQAKEARA